MIRQVKKADCLLSGHFCFLLCEDSENQGAGNGNGKEKRYLCTGLTERTMSKILKVRNVNDYRLISFKCFIFVQV